MQKLTFKEIWKYIEIPVYIMILWTLLATFFPLTNYMETYYVGIIGWIITLIFFGYISYKMSQKEEKKGEVAKAGAIAGALTGLAGALIAIIAYYISPGLFSEAINQITSNGGSAAMIQIGLYIGILMGPAVSAVIGAVICLIGALVFQKNQKQKSNTKKEVSKKPKKNVKPTKKTKK